MINTSNIYQFCVIYYTVFPEICNYSKNISFFPDISSNHLKQFSIKCFNIVKQE